MKKRRNPREIEYGAVANILRKKSSWTYNGGEVRYNYLYCDMMWYEDGNHLVNDDGAKLRDFIYDT